MVTLLESARLLDLTQAPRWRHQLAVLIVASIRSRLSRYMAPLDVRPLLGDVGPCCVHEKRTRERWDEGRQGAINWTPAIVQDIRSQCRAVPASCARLRSWQFRAHRWRRLSALWVGRRLRMTSLIKIGAKSGGRGRYILRLH